MVSIELMCGREASGAAMLKRVRFGLTYTYVYVRKNTFVFTSGLTMVTVRESNPANMFAKNLFPTEIGYLRPPNFSIQTH